MDSFIFKRKYGTTPALEIGKHSESKPQIVKNIAFKSDFTVIRAFATFVKALSYFRQRRLGITFTNTKVVLELLGLNTFWLNSAHVIEARMKARAIAALFQ